MKNNTKNIYIIIIIKVWLEKVMAEEMKGQREREIGTERERQRE